VTRGARQYSPFFVASHSGLAAAQITRGDHHGRNRD
jgi:hypothetical protein